MDDQTFPANPPDHPQENQAESPQSAWPPPLPPSPVSPPNQAQPPYPPQAAPPSQPMYPPYGQPGPSYGPPNYGPYGQPQQPSYPLYGQPPTNPSYPGYGQPGYAAPSQPLYPPAGQPPPPPSPPHRGLKAWQWALIGVAVIVFACCTCGAISSAMNGGSANGIGAAIATDTPAATDTPQPTPTPVPPGVGNHMAIGHDYGKNANGFYITQPANKFSSRDEFAYVVTLDQGIGTTQFKLVFAQEQAGGVESVVYSETDDVSNPKFNQFTNKFPIRDVLGGYSTGTYKVEMETDSAVVASVTFTYTG